MVDGSDSRTILPSARDDLRLDEANRRRGGESRLGADGAARARRLEKARRFLRGRPVGPSRRPSTRSGRDRAGTAASATGPPGLPKGVSLTETVRDLEVRLLRRALAQCRYNQHKAAELLGLTYHQFRGLYRKYRGELG